MSYLDLPRISFSGLFLASPATINNTPDNYKADAYNEDGSLNPEQVELYWEPEGDSIFDLRQTKVTHIDQPGSPSDRLMGLPVSALYTGAPPKLVDLDPMQQNGSEIWGLTLRIGAQDGPNVQGTYTPIAFHSIWGMSQGDNTPRNSTSGSAVYTSTLKNLVWNVAGSPVLAALQRQSPDRLSIHMTVYAHNRAADMFVFNDATFAAMLAAGVPTTILAKIEVLKKYSQLRPGDLGSPAPWEPGPGHIPTVQYVNHLLEEYLGQADAQVWGPKITAATEQLPYKPWIVYESPFTTPLIDQPLTPFNYGMVVGSIGPSADDEPDFAVPVRTLQQPSDGKKPKAFWAPAKLDSTAPRLTLDLSNALPRRMPGGPPWTDMLGTLSLAYYTQVGGEKTYTTFVPSLPYDDPGFMETKAGLVTVTDFGPIGPTALDQLPIALMSTVGGATRPLLEENSSGLSIQANQFIFRMNPGLPTTPEFPRGDTNRINIHVRRFGNKAGTDGVEVALHVMSQEDAKTYTLSTLGTSNTNGIRSGCLSWPEGVLGFSPGPTLQVSDGLATATVSCRDPGNPRGAVDGQVYFVQYAPKVPPKGYNADPDQLISVQVYTQTPIRGLPTWHNGIGAILRQYGWLYPVMARFQLWSYEGVKLNKDKILRVLKTDPTQPLHMPVTRDLSEIRRLIIVSWLENGMPEGVAGGDGTS